MVEVCVGTVSLLLFVLKVAVQVMMERANCIGVLKT